MQLSAMKAPEGNEVATAEEAAQALAALSAADLARLNLLAQVRAATVPGLEWRDLLHEAVEHVLDGRRKWPRHLPFMVFFREVMRSLASAWRVRSRNAPIRTEADLPANDDGTAPVLDAVCEQPGQDREVAARMTLDAICGLFGDDVAALAIIDGLGAGASPSEIQVSAELTPTQYASAQKRIRRTLARHFPEGMP